MMRNFASVYPVAVLSKAAPQAFEASKDKT